MLLVKREAAMTNAFDRSLALVCRNLFDEPSALSSVGRFELVRTLGSGGMGVVYEAHDPERGERVALKMLNGRGPKELYRLKREFRSLVALDHPNLVALHELNVSGPDAFFTMDLIAGKDLLSYVEHACAGRDGMDHERLRHVLGQLCEGVTALHAAGKLHRDLKPSNVLVTELERVVLLDFGLVRDAREESTEVEGTPAYMAPEHYGGRSSEASDWYSFGCILMNVLRVWAKRTRSAPDGTLADLNQLAQRLRTSDPRQRPHAAEIVAIVRGRQASERPQSRSPTTVPFVGRSAELTALQKAFVRSRRRAALVVLRGEAGIGKTTLLQRFVASLPDEARAIVLRGRCYEREFVPYKALDGVIDELSRTLSADSHSALVQLAEDERRALVQLFPVFGRVPLFASVDNDPEELHPVSVRGRGFSALKRLLRVLAATRPLVLCIDDLQWSDTDSGALLSALLCDDDGPPVLVVGSDRTPPGSLNPAMQELARASQNALRSADLEQLDLRNLAHDEAFSLASELLSAHAGRDDALAARLAEESLGNPLFLTELSHWACASVSERSLRARSSGASIDSIVAERVAALSEDAHNLLSLIALAGRPLSSTVLERTLELGNGQHGVLRELRRARLIHALRRADEELLEIEHDRIGEAVLRRVPPAARRDLHARLASALDAEEDLQSEGSLAQYIAAGMSEEAAERARRAGELALSALAFSRAAWLFERALELGRWPDAVRAHLYSELAISHEHAGQGLRAAAAYRNAASLCTTVAESVQLETQAAEHLMHNGHFAEGLPLLQRCYERLELRWPQGRMELLLRTLYLLALVQLRVPGKQLGNESRQRHVARARLFSLAGTCLEGFDALRSLYNALLMVREAESSPEPTLRVRALALRGFLRCAALLRGGAARGLAELNAAWRVAGSFGDLSVRIDVQRQLAAAHQLNGDPRAALATAALCEADLKIYPLPPRDLYRVMGVVGYALWDLGELAAARERWLDFSHAARHQGDAATSFWVHVNPARFALLIAAGDRSAAHAMLERQRELCALHPAFKFLHWNRAICAVEAALYWETGPAMLRSVELECARLSSAGYPSFRAVALLLRTRATLAVAASEPDGKRRAELLRCARRATRRLRLLHRDKAARVAVAWLEASQAMLLPKPEEALIRLESAIALFDAQGSKLMSACARYCQGVLLGNQAGEQIQNAASKVMQQEGVIDHERWVRRALPGLRAVETRANATRR
jgi:hypothetical protein